MRIFKKYVVISFVTLFASAAFAKADKAIIQYHIDNFHTDQQIQKFVNSGNSNSLLLRQLKIRKLNCNNQGGISPKSCIEAVCSKVSKFDCDDASEIQTVAKMCKNNVDGDCIDTVCSKVSKFECDDLSELKTITNMCSGQFSSKCLDFTCSKLSTFDCDDVSEVKAIMTSTCRPDMDPDCMEVVCSKLSKFDCDDLSEIQSIAKSCSVN